AVGAEVSDGRAAEHRLRRFLEFDDDLGAALPERLARAEVDRHAFPAPVVDVEAGGGVGFGFGFRVDVLLLAVAGLDDLAAFAELWAVLAADYVALHFLGRVDAD